MTTDDSRPAFVQDAEDAAEAIRAINHATIVAPTGIPAPDVYAFLGEIIRATAGLSQSLDQIGGGLLRSLDHFEVTDHDGNPETNAAAAADAMRQASDCARQATTLLDAAQSAIAGQGYREAAKQDN